MRVFGFLSYFSVLLNLLYFGLWAYTFKIFQNHPARPYSYNELGDFAPLSFQVTNLLLSFISVVYFAKTRRKARSLKLFLLGLQALSIGWVIWGNL